MPDSKVIHDWYVDNNATMMEVAEKFGVTIELAYQLVRDGA